MTGSSGGNAAAIAARMLDAGIGEDTPLASLGRGITACHVRCHAKRAGPSRGRRYRDSRPDSLARFDGTTKAGRLLMKVRANLTEHVGATRAPWSARLLTLHAAVVAGRPDGRAQAWRAALRKGCTRVTSRGLERAVRQLGLKQKSVAAASTALTDFLSE
jgi:hypothetical protein